MANNYVKETAYLVNFLEKKEKYSMQKKWKVGQNKSLYLTKPAETEFQIVNILSDYNEPIEDLLAPDGAISLISRSLRRKMDRDAKIKVLFIIFNETKTDVLTTDDYIVYHVTSDNYLNKLDDILLGLDDFVSNQETNWSQMVGTEEFMDEVNNPDSHLNTRLRQLSDKLQPGNMAILWTIVILLIAVPIILVFFGPMFGLSGAGGFFSSAAGGLNRDLMVGLGQWWRLFTYPFIFNISGFNFILLFLYVFVIYFAIKYCILMANQWQVLITFICSMPMCGFIVAMASPQDVFAGPMLLACSMYGMLLFFSYMNKDLSSFIARGKTVWIAVVIIILPLFSSPINWELYLFYFVSFLVGGCFGYMFSYNYHQLDWTLIMPVIVLVGTIIVPIILMETNVYWPANNMMVFGTINLYVNNGVMSQHSAISFLHRYYGLTNLDIKNIFGWNL